MTNQLPNGWVKTTLGEIVEPLRERALPMESPDTYYIGLEHIESQTMKLLGHGYARNVRSSSMRFSRGDVLYGKMRPYLNKVWVAEFDGICSTEFLIFPKQDNLNNKFLAIRLNAEDFVTFANKQVSGERPRVGFEKLSKFIILLPPLTEQNRIVTKLNTVLSRVQRGETAACRARERLINYRAAVLKAAVTGELTKLWRETEWKSIQANAATGDELLLRLLAARRACWGEANEKWTQVPLFNETNNDNWGSGYREPVKPRVEEPLELPSGWAWASVDQLAAHEERSITDGPFGSNLKSSHYTESGPRVVRLQNIGDGVFIDERSHISQEHYEALKRYAIYAGDLVIRALGTPAPRACKIPESLGPAIVKADCIRFKVAMDYVSPDYVMWALNAPPVRARTEKLIHGIGRPRLNLNEIKSIAIPLPSMSEQIQIVREIESRLSAADRLILTLDQQLARSSSIRQLILRKAFAGQLVHQSPDDQPASILLEQIRFSNMGKEQKKKVKHMPSSKSTIKRRPLINVLREHNSPMKPEELFREAGFDASQVDLFYRELALLRDMLWVEMPKGIEAKSWPYNASVTLQLKEA